MKDPWPVTAEGVVCTAFIADRGILAQYTPLLDSNIGRFPVPEMDVGSNCNWQSNAGCDCGHQAIRIPCHLLLKSFGAWVSSHWRFYIAVFVASRKVALPHCSAVVDINFLT